MLLRFRHFFLYYFSEEEWLCTPLSPMTSFLCFFTAFLFSMLTSIFIWTLPLVLQFSIPPLLPYPHLFFSSLYISSLLVPILSFSPLLPSLFLFFISPLISFLPLHHQHGFSSFIFFWSAILYTLSVYPPMSPALSSPPSLQQVPTSLSSVTQHPSFIPLLFFISLSSASSFLCSLPLVVGPFISAFSPSSPLSARSISLCEWMPEKGEMNGLAFVPRCVSSCSDIPLPACPSPLRVRTHTCVFTHKHTPPAYLMQECG